MRCAASRQPPHATSHREGTRPWPTTSSTSLQEFKLASGATGKFYSLPALEKAGIGKISRLPVSIRIVLESVLRNCDGKKVTEEHVRAARQLGAERRAHRRDSVRRRARRAAGLHRRAAAGRPRGDAQRRRATWARTRRSIEPLVPVDLVVDHSVMIDYYGTPDALDLNMKLEFERNGERYQFMKWGMQAFDTFKVVPPGIGIVHQVNLEYLARGVHQQRRRLLPGHAGRHRQPHDDDQRHRRRRLGRGRHRSRSRHARPAGLFPHARRRRRRAEGQAARRRHRHRSRADRHRDAAQGEGRRQVRRVLRRRHGVARRARPRDDRQHGARIRRDDGLLPGRRRDRRLPRGHRPHRRGDRRVRVVLQGAGAVRHSARRRDRLHQGRRRSISRRSSRRSPGPKRPQDRIELGKPQGEVHRALQQAGRPRTASRRRRGQARASAITTARVAGRRRRDQRRDRCRLPRNGQPRDLVEMVDNRPTPDRVASRDAASTCRHRQRRRADRRDHVVHQHVESRACCSPPACSRRRRSRRA